MKLAIILLLIIIGSCLAMYTIKHEPFYGRGEDYEAHMFVSNECPALSCINQPCASPYES